MLLWREGGGRGGQDKNKTKDMTRTRQRTRHKTNGKTKDNEGQASQGPEDRTMTKDKIKIR